MFVDNPELICKAIIRSTDGIRRFCSKLCSECTTQRHFDDDEDNPTVDRASVVEGAILIVPRKGQALESPCAMRHWFSDDEFAKMMDRKKKIVVWSEWFGLRATEAQIMEEAKSGGLMDDGDEEEWEEVASSPRISVETVEEGREDLLSPKSAGLSEAAAKLPQTVEVKKEGMLLKPTRLMSLENYLVENGAEGLSPELLSSLNEIVKDWAKVQENFETIASHLADQSKLQGLLKQTLEETLKLTDDKFKKLDTKAGLLYASIGRNTNSSNDGELSVWSAIRGLQLEIKGLGGSLDKLDQALSAEAARRAAELDMVNKLLPTISGDCDQQLQTFRDQYANRMSTLHHILTSLTNRLSALEAGPTVGPHHGATYHGRSYDEVIADLERGLRDLDQAFSKNELQRLQVELQSLQAQVQQFVNGAPGGISHATPSRHGGTPASPGNSWDHLAANAGLRASSAGVTWVPSLTAHVTQPVVPNPYYDIPDLVPQIQDLSAQVKKLSERNGSSTCDFGRWVFNSDRDVSTFLERTNMEIGWAVDLFSALVAMASGKRTGRSLADDFWSASRIGSTNLRNNLLAAMSSDRPACLFGDDGNGKAKSMTEGMARVKSHNDWAATAEPYRNTLERDLNGFLLGVNGAMPAEESIRDPNELEGVQFAKHLIMLVRAQWSALIGFIDTSYIELRFRATSRKNCRGYWWAGSLPQCLTKCYRFALPPCFLMTQLR